LGKKEYALLRLYVFDRDNRRCRICSVRNPLHVHHIVFRSNGGPDESWNLLTVCLACHDGLHFRGKPGQGVVVMPFKEGDAINADGKLKFLYFNGWSPSNKLKRSK
jgi:5-methylcytosine-specific restriction endonuclease McrA